MKTQYDPRIHHRRSIRLTGYDYSQAGTYFVTVVTQSRLRLFGEVLEGEMMLNEFGKIVAETWQWLKKQYPYVELGVWVVMPDHFHGILIITDQTCTGGSRTARTAAKQKPLGRLIGAFKTVSTKKINLLRHTEGNVIWHRNYFEHIIRNQQDLELTWLYIESNPVRWADDKVISIPR